MPHPILPNPCAVVSVRVLVCVRGTLCVVQCVLRARQEKQQGGTHSRGVWKAHVKKTRPAAEISADGERRKHGASEQKIRAVETSRAVNGTEKDPSLLRRITAPQHSLSLRKERKKRVRHHTGGRLERYES